MHLSTIISVGRPYCLYCAVIALVGLISACSGTSTITPAPSLTSLLEEITLAEQQGPPEQDIRFTKLAGQLHEIGEREKAINLINRVNTTTLNDEQYISYVIIASDIYTADQALFLSKTLLSSDRLDQLWDTLSLEQQQQLLQQKADTHNQLGNYEQSATEFIALDSLLVDSLDIIQNHETLWQVLNQLSTEKLIELEQTTEDPIARGWYQLANISKVNEDNLESKRVQVNSWASINPTHPASLELPLDLQLLNTLIEQRPKKVALLLPMQGKLAIAGKTIRDGFFAAYYNKGQDYKPEVSLYDTSQEAVNSLYDRAVNEGADLVIGPLQKEKLVELEQREQLQVPALALNYSISPSDTNTSTGFNSLQPLYQFGLSLEDEAIQAADRAWLEGHRYAMVMASDADWSKRAVDAFIQQWQKRGGKVIVNREFNTQSSYSNTIKSAFEIDKSQSRARKLKRLFGKNFEFEPRRRQDIDMIFLVARSSEGQQIKPTLAFHYAGKIPVYATSQIFSNTQAISKNRDLNGIRFTTLPWTLDPSSRDENLTNKALKIPPNYERLYAMGIDAFRLHDRLKQLARSPNTSIDGSTGKLRLDENKRIVREQPWAEIVKGEAQALPYLTQENPEY